MALPTSLLLLVFFIVPTLILLPASLCAFDVRMRPTFVGLANFAAIFASAGVRKAVSVTALLGGVTFVSILATALIGGMALASLKAGGRLRMAFQLAAMLGSAANAVFWVWIFSPVWGGLVRAFQGAGLTPIAWHSQPFAAQIACCIVLWAWNFPGNVYFVSIAARAVNAELLEAAMLDGANSWQQFWYITMPIVRKPLAYMAVTMVAGLCQIYEVPMLLWQGGPLGSTTTIVMRISKFVGGYGQAAAMSLLLTVVVSALCAVAWKMGKA